MTHCRIFMFVLLLMMIRLIDVTPSIFYGSKGQVLQ